MGTWTPQAGDTSRINAFVNADHSNGTFVRVKVVETDAGDGVPTAVGQAAVEDVADALAAHPELNNVTGFWGYPSGDSAVYIP